MKPSSFRELAERIQSPIRERWREAHASPYAAVLKLSLLRDFAKELHKEKSQLLAGGSPELVRDVQALERVLETLPDSFFSAASFDELLDTHPAPARAVPKPDTQTREQLFKRIDAEKLTRFDRAWELALLDRALPLQWEIWTLEIWLDISQTEKWHQCLLQWLWPKGLLLFVETPGLGESGLKIGEISFWHGRWYLLFSPGENPKKHPEWTEEMIRWHLPISPESLTWKSL